MPCTRVLHPRPAALHELPNQGAAKLTETSWARMVVTSVSKRSQVRSDAKAASPAFSNHDWIQLKIEHGPHASLDGGYEFSISSNDLPQGFRDGFVCCGIRAQGAITSVMYW